LSADEDAASIREPATTWPSRFAPYGKTKTSQERVWCLPHPIDQTALSHLVSSFMLHVSSRPFRFS
jgi:hypothetical protein